MPFSSTKVAAAVLLLVFAGGPGWQRMRPSSSAHVEMLASVETPRGASVTSGLSTAAMPGSPKRRAGASMQGTARDGSASSASAPAPPWRAGPQIAAAPSLEVVRVEPSGDALLAGRSKPNATVALLDRGRVVAETRTDAGGNFVMTPPALKPGDYALSQRGGQGARARVQAERRRVGAGDADAPPRRAVESGLTPLGVASRFRELSIGRRSFASG